MRKEHVSSESRKEDFESQPNIQGRSPGLRKRWGEKVSAVQSALTDVLYIACHFILREYWGVAKLKPGRHSNPSPALLTSVGGWGLKSHLEACSQYFSHPVSFIKGTSPRPLSRTDHSSIVVHTPLPPVLHYNTVTQTDSTLRTGLNLDYYLQLQMIIIKNINYICE